METLSTLRDAVAHASDPAAAWFQLGMALDRRGETGDALAALRAAAAANPREAQYQFVVASLLATRRGAYEEAAEGCVRALALDPRCWKAAGLLAWLYGVMLDRPADARSFAVQAIELNPDARPAYAHLCRALLEGDPVETMLARVEAACPPRGRRDLLHAGLGTALMQVGRYEEVCRLLRDRVREEPPHALLLAALGSAESVLGEHEAAGAHLERAFQLAPSDDFVRNMFLTEAWRIGDYDRIAVVLADIAAHLQSSASPHGSAPPRPAPANGGFSGRTVLLKEMPDGYGDTIQCARRASMLHARVARVILECRRPLRSLLETVSGAAGVVVPHDEYPAVDDVYYPFQLPPTLQWSWDEGARPYLSLPAASQRAWSARLLAAGGGVHVGVEWKTGDDVTHRDNPYRRRAVALDELAPLVALRGTTWHALNIGRAGRQDIAALPPSVRLNDLAEQLPDFIDTAAAVTALDLVVTVDTALAHVAGALGKATFLLLPYHADWRWGRTGRTVRWYPSVRAFRQPAPGHWAPVVDEVKEALLAIVRSREQPDSVAV